MQHLIWGVGRKLCAACALIIVSGHLQSHVSLVRAPFPSDQSVKWFIKVLSSFWISELEGSHRRCIRKLALLQDLQYVLPILETAEKMEKEICFSVVKSRISNCGFQLRNSFMDVDGASSLWPHMKEGLSLVFSIRALSQLHDLMTSQMSQFLI